MNISKKSDENNSKNRANSKDSNNNNNSFFSKRLDNISMNRNRAHLFRLYPILCKLIKVTDNDIKSCLFDLFQVIGNELGLMQ